MDIGIIRGIGTVLVFVAFIAIVLWAYSAKRKSSFDEAANLPFADEQPDKEKRDQDSSGSNNQ